MKLRLLGRVVRCGLIEFLAFSSGLILVYKDFLETGNSWKIFEPVNYVMALALMFVDGTLYGRAGLLGDGINLQGKFLRFSPPIILFLYVSCCVLLKRMRWTLISWDLISSAGLMLMSIGVLFSFWAVISLKQQPLYEPVAIDQEGILLTEALSDQPENGNGRHDDFAKYLPGPCKLLRYPRVSGALLVLAGIPLLFEVWSPLLALPGFVILFKWLITDLERSRVDTLELALRSQGKGRFRIVPYIY